MPLRRSPHRSPAFLGACFANSRMPNLNALKHVRYAKDFRRLVLGRCRADARLYDFILGQLYLSFRAPNPLRRCRSRADGGPSVLLALGARAAPRPGNEAGMCPGINGFTKYAPIAHWLGSDGQLGNPVAVPRENAF